eukprot:MONOS_3483.1-p1 / transcript=MONOS_3483.1 / gene=MONOS_3483 / organism=Monocercomonoides_exilis_PA203 / gene_product=unspecified product / transcript_product=unspecified product / location=Mono_scaffold00082:99855-100860(+) / protein_length=305 / sequence_SO=supercontig / SO=protein_coding / is_pseudo=false
MNEDTHDIYDLSTPKRKQVCFDKQNSSIKSNSSENKNEEFIEIEKLIKEIEEKEKDDLTKIGELKGLEDSESEESDEYGLVQAENDAIDDELETEDSSFIREDFASSSTSPSSSISQTLRSSSSSSEHFSDIDTELRNDSFHCACSTAGEETFQDEEEVQELFSTKKIDLCIEFNEEKEKTILQEIQNLLYTNWFPRLDRSFTNYARSVLKDYGNNSITACKLFFENQMKSKPEEMLEKDPEIFYNVIAEFGNLQSLYSGLCLSLILSPCSEASCERIISKIKNIIGDKRNSISLQTLEALLHI